jgi:hypothetical protein
MSSGPQAPPEASQAPPEVAAKTAPVELPLPGEGFGARAVGKLPGGRGLSPLARVAIAVAFVALLFGLALVAQPWGFIGLGAVFGVLVAARVPAARAGLMPVDALARAVLPLLIPLLVFVAAGVVKSPPGLQFAVGLATLLAAWAWLIRPDWDRVQEILRPRRRVRSAARSAAEVALPLALVACALGFLASSLAVALSDSDSVARTLFVLAVGCLAFAAVLRLVSYARTAFRALVSLALLLLLARLAVAVGVIPGGEFERVDAATLAVIAGAMLVLTAVVEVISALLERGAADQGGVPSDQLPTPIRVGVLLNAPVAARWITDRAGLAGLALSLLSATLLLLAVFSASNAGGASEDRDGLPGAGQPPRSPTDMTDRELADAFSPVLLFTADQRWTPIAVDDYVRGAFVTDWEQRATRVHSVDELEEDCPGVVKTPCYTIEQRCPAHKTESDCAEDLQDQKAAYVRVARRDDWRGCRRLEACVDGSPDPFAAAPGPYAKDTQILVQYWYFYPFNEWVAPVVIGELKEIHPADWEAVTVGLSGDEPLWVAYSAHCAGTYADWKRVRVAGSDPQRLRPLVAVANGSQANYRVAEESRVPNFAECSGIPKDRLTLASYAANIHDRTDDSTVWDPAASDLRIVTATTPPMSFPGRWSRYSRLTLENLRKQLRLGKDGGGPQTPSLQALWQSPMRTIFGGGAWKEG